MITYLQRFKYVIIAAVLSALFITGSFIFILKTVLSSTAKDAGVNSISDNLFNQGFIVVRKGDTFVALKGVSNEVFFQDKHADVVFARCISELTGNGGGEIKVENGIFPFHAPVKLESRIKILGSGRATTFVLAADNADGVIFIASSKDEILLSDFVCQGDLSNTNEKASGIIIDNSGDCEVRSVFCRDFSGYGFWLRNDSFLCKFVDCVSANNGKAEYYISEINAGGRGGDYITNDVKNCMGYASRGNGIEVYASLCVNIVGCNMYHPKKNGYYFRQGSNSILLSGSRCFKAEGNGILIENSHELNVSSNIICWNRGHGIELNHVIWGTVTGNEFIDSGGSVEPKKYGVYLHTDTRGIQVVGNTVFAWEDQLRMIYGIYEKENCQSNIIMGNFINRYDDDAIYSKGKETLTINNTGVKESYEKVYNEPFPAPRTEKVKPFPPFTRDDIEAYLKNTQR